MSGLQVLPFLSYYGKTYKYPPDTEFEYLFDLLQTLGCPVNAYMFKVNTINTTKRCEICSKLTKTA